MLCCCEVLLMPWIVDEMVDGEGCEMLLGDERVEEEAAMLW